MSVAISKCYVPALEDIVAHVPLEYVEAHVPLEDKVAHVPLEYVEAHIPLQDIVARVPLEDTTVIHL